MLYKDNIKIVPQSIGEYLTPLALAIWFMDDGSKLGKGAKIATNCFSHKEIEYLCLILKKKYNLDTSIHTGGKDKGQTIYIKSSSMPNFSKIVKPFMITSMLYKLGDY
jgi:ubiquinol-cytochrome c reductase cytochrome b subunit